MPPGDTPSKTERRTSTRERPRADSGEADGWDQQVVTPALPSERQTPLMPAKADAHRLHMELGWSGIAIAEAKGVKHRRQTGTSRTPSAREKRTGWELSV